MELISKEVVKRIIDSGRTREQMLGMVECAVTYGFWAEDSSTECVVTFGECDDCISREAVLDLVDSYSESRSNVEDVTQYMISDILALPPVNPQEPKWIPCSERLPKESGEYLVTFGEITTMGETIEKWVGFNNFATYGRWCNKCMQPVVAWMPKPEPYCEK